MKSTQNLLPYLLFFSSGAFGMSLLDFLPPSSLLNSSYVSVKFGQSRSDINSYSLASMSCLASQNYHPTGYLENGLTALAEWDREHGTAAFKQQVEAGNTLYAENAGPCQSYWKVPMVNQFNDFPSWVALGALEEYAAYGDGDRLDQAKQVFQFISDHGYITQNDADTGFLLNTKPNSNKLQPTCNGQSMLGGVYWQNGCPEAKEALSNPNVNAVSTGLYALLGASLCRITNDTTYCEQAYSSLHWIDRVLKQDNNLIADHVNATSCNVTSNELFTYNSAIYIAAYADLGNQTNNSTALSLARNTAIASMNTAEWNSAQGVITEGVGKNLKESAFPISFGPVLVRYLHRSYPYLAADLQEAVIQYLNIQYWATTQLDSDHPTHPKEFGRNWTGPAFELATPQSQAAALDVLNGIMLNPNSSFPNTTNTSSPVALSVSPSMASNITSILLGNLSAPSNTPSNVSHVASGAASFSSERNMQFAMLLSVVLFVAI